MIQFDFLIVSRVISYTEAERLDIEELERMETAAKIWQGGL